MRKNIVAGNWKMNNDINEGFKTNFGNCEYGW